MGPLGVQEMAAILILAFLLFGPKELPRIAKQIGRALTEFRRASNELKATFDRELGNLEREGEDESIREVPRSYLPDSYRYGDDYGRERSYSDPAPPAAPDDPAATTALTVSAPGGQGAESKSGTAPEGTISTAAPNASATEVGALEATPSAHSKTKEV